jgi:type II secretory pathway component PulM
MVPMAERDGRLDLQANSVSFLVLNPWLSGELEPQSLSVNHPDT